MPTVWTPWAAVYGILCPIALLTVRGWPLWAACTATLATGAALLARLCPGDRRAWMLLPLGCALAAWRLQASADAPAFAAADSLIDWLAGYRAAVSRQIGLLLPEPESSFMAGILLGERSAMPQGILMDMRTTGLTHILAISGFNIALILLFLEQCLFFLPRRMRTAPLGIGIAAFTLFTGASASAVRACLMGILQVMALHIGRPTQTRLLVAWTACGMLLWHPRALTDDLGFQLSFLAVIGIMEIGPFLQRPLERLPSALGIREGMIMTLAAQCTASAWAAVQFGSLPLHSPVLNLLVAPLLPVAMLSGAAALAVGWLVPPLGIALALPGWLALKTILLIVHMGALATPLIIGGFEHRVTLVGAWYALLGWLICRAQNRSAP